MSCLVSVVGLAVGKVKDCRREIFVAFRCAGSGFPRCAKLSKFPQLPAKRTAFVVWLFRQAVEK